MSKHTPDDFNMIKLIAWRELRDQLRDWRIIIPIIILTVILPILGNTGAKAAINFTTKYGTPIIAERLVPFLMLVVGFFPITVSLVISLEAFVGEKERGTIEPLLASPLKDWHLYIGKLLSGTAIPLMTSYLGIGVYSIGLLIQKIPFPDGNRMAQILILTTVQAFLMVSGAILISTQSTSIRAANLLASFIVIPMALLVQGEAVMLFWGNDQLLWLAVVGVFILALLLGRVGIAYFRREALLGREIDVLNLRWVGRMFWASFAGKAKNFRNWYSIEIRSTLHRQTPAIYITLSIGILSAVAGYIFIQNNQLVLPDNPINTLGNLLAGSVDIPLVDKVSYFDIFLHNLQSLLIISLLGAFSFATLGSLMYSLNTAIIGIVLSLVDISGNSALNIGLLGILPHGIFEIPALVLSTAAILYGAVLLVTPHSKSSLGEAIIRSIADWLKIFISIALPLLVIAAAVETWITPRLLSLIVK